MMRPGWLALEIGLLAVPARDGRVLSIHDIGVGVVLVPAYIVARHIAEWTAEPLLRRFGMDRGLFTYSIVILFLIALTTAGMVLVADGLTPLAGRRRATLLVRSLERSAIARSGAPRWCSAFHSCCLMPWSGSIPGRCGRPAPSIPRSRCWGSPGVPTSCCWLPCTRRD
jgi:hypothetical protein